MDYNREVEEAAQGCGNAIDAYNDYHTKLLEKVNSFVGRGLVIDLHGQVRF